MLQTTKCVKRSICMITHIQQGPFTPCACFHLSCYPLADSEYETDDSSADEATEEESERTKGGGSTADTLEGGGTEDSATTTTATSPSSPAVKNAARASFFSAPPTVVRLDPWRMFNKDNKKDEQGGAVEENVEEVVAEDAANRADNDHDTDVSESLEMDSRGEEGRGSSAEGSIEDLMEDEDESGQRESSVEREVPGDRKEMEEGEREEEEMDDEDMEKTAVSLAMEQLLVDIDQTSVGGSDNAAELDNLLPSDIDEDVFHTGRTQRSESARLGDLESDRGRIPSEDTGESVLRSVREMGDTTTITSGTDTLRQVLADVAAMPDLSDSEVNHDEDRFKNVDERFVTDRRKPRKKRRAAKEGGGSDSDMTISTPSRSSSSSSSSSLGEMIEYNQRFLASGDAEDNLKPDEDMMREYMTTMSMALEESFSDGEKDASVLDKSDSTPRDEMNRTLQAEDMEEAGKQEGQDNTKESQDVSKESNASVYLTPEVSMEEKAESRDDFKDAVESLPAGASQGPGKLVSPVVVTQPAAGKGLGAVVKQPSTQSHKPAPKGNKVVDTKKTKDSRGPAVKGPRKLPEVPKPKVSASQPQNSKKNISNKVTAPDSRNKLPAAKSTRPSSARSGLPSSSSASDSSKQRATSSTSESSKQRASSVASSDSSRTSVSRPLPRPGMAKRVSSSVSSDRASSSPGSVRSAGHTVNRTSTPVSQPPVNGEGARSKTVIHVDRGTLWSDSSTDQQTSDSELGKKKIPVDASVRALPEPHKPSVISDIDDIPFADESEVDDNFYTPSTSVKAKPEPAPPAESRTNIRKRILPSPPLAAGASPPLPSPQQIHSIKQAEQAKAKQVASDKWPKQEEEGKSAAFTNPAHGSAAGVLKRRAGVRLHDDPRDRRSSSYDAPSTPDVLSDSDDSRQQLANTSTTNTPTSSANELDGTPKNKKKSRDKAKSSTASAAKVKMRKSKDFANKRKNEEKSSGEEAKKEKNRRSLLAMFKSKSGDKHKDKAGHVQGSDGDLSLPEKHKSVKPSDEDKHKKSKSKHKRNKSGDSLDEGLTSDIRGLKITSVFDREGGQGDGAVADRRHLRPIPIAPKASGQCVWSVDGSLFVAFFLFSFFFMCVTFFLKHVCTVFVTGKWHVTRVVSRLLKTDQCFCFHCLLRYISFYFISIVCAGI